MTDEVAFPRSQRRFRPKIASSSTGGDVGLRRRPLIHRPPYLTKAGAPGAIRSWMDGQAKVSTTAAPSTTRYPGDGLPNTPVVAPASMRRICTTANSRRDILEWRHPTNWGWWKDNSLMTPSQDDRWWQFMGVPVPYSDPNYTTQRRCTFPMGDEAVFTYRGTGYHLLGTGPHTRIYDVVLASRPGTLGELIPWQDFDTYSYSRIVIKRRCSRILVYPGCVLDNGEVKSLVSGYSVPNAPYAIVREIDPGRTENAGFTWKAPGAAPSAPWIPCPAPQYQRPKNDIRFWPFGLTDVARCIRYGANDDNGLNEYNLHNFPSDMMREAWYEHDGGAIIPPSPQGPYSQKDSFTTKDLAHISARKLAEGMAYASQAWADERAYNRGAGLLAGRVFDMLVYVSFYKWTRYVNTDHKDREAFKYAADGFAGAYGSCFAIF